MKQIEMEMDLLALKTSIELCEKKGENPLDDLSSDEDW